MAIEVLAHSGQGPLGDQCLDIIDQEFQRSLGDHGDQINATVNQ